MPECRLITNSYSYDKILAMSSLVVMASGFGSNGTDSIPYAIKDSPIACAVNVHKIDGFKNPK